jgi:hypothetical protein
MRLNCMSSAHTMTGVCCASRQWGEGRMQRRSFVIVFDMTTSGRTHRSAPTQEPYFVGARFFSPVFPYHQRNYEQASCRVRL